jgi:biotin transport system substrate-specific component
VATTHAVRRNAVLGDLLPGALTRDVALVVGSAVFVGLAAQVTVPIPAGLLPVAWRLLGRGES